MQININHQKNSWYTNLTISADLYGLLASRVLKEAEKLVLKFPRTLLSRHYNKLQLAYFWKYFEILKVKGQVNLQNTTVNINL